MRKLSFLLLLVGCAADDVDLATLGDSEQAITCPTPSLVTARSLAVTDPQILARFSFQRVMDRLTTTGKSTITSLQLYKDWMATWGACRANLDPNGYGIRCTRPEAQFGAFDPFAATGPRFEPVALMNRFDLAPSTGTDCGEYRIVYALKESIGDRGFIIFEGRLPNPTPGDGLAGCTGVADFWARLSLDNDVTSRATKLERFYFTGITAEGRTYAPVVTAASYGMDAMGVAAGKGQIRTNFFADFNEWHLREFKLGKPCAAADACRLAVTQVTVKANPADELFRGTHARTAAFEASFLKQIPALSRKNAATIAMATNNAHNELESSAQVPNVVYRGFTRASFKNQIAAAITNPNLTANNILDRATTQTCGGCHQFSNATPNLGDGVTWRGSLGFVHVDESSSLSPALVQTFLPRRATVLKAFLDRQCGTMPSASEGIGVEGQTVGGSALDAH